LTDCYNCVYFYTTMFLRTHTVSGGYAYTEALESYRDPVTRKPKHRVLARWPVSQSLAEVIAEAEASVAFCQQRLADPRFGGKRDQTQWTRSLIRPERRLATLRRIEAATAPATPP
jgi:hypothetical protein